MTGTNVLGPCTLELEASLAERRRLGQDVFDEVWRGVDHRNPGQIVEWHAPVDGAGEPTDHSAVLGVDTAGVVDAMRW